MADVIILDVSPSAAILNSTDSALPTKTREAGINQPRFVLKYSNSLENRAFWSWPLSPQNAVGAVLGSATLRLHWTANSGDTNNVQFAVKGGFVEEGQDIDKALGAEVFGPIQAFSGTPNSEHYTEIPLPALLSSFPLTKSGRIVLQVRRNIAVASPLASVVSLLKSQLDIDFVSNLEKTGPRFSTIPVTTASASGVRSNFGKHYLIDTDVIGVPTDFFLPTESSSDPLVADDDGFMFLVSKKGPHQVDIKLEAGATIIRGAPTPIPLVTDGDSVILKYSSYDNAYHVF